MGSRLLWCRFVTGARNSRGLGLESGCSCRVGAPELSNWSSVRAEARVGGTRTAMDWGVSCPLAARHLRLLM